MNPIWKHPQSSTGKNPRWQPPLGSKLMGYSLEVNKRKAVNGQYCKKIPKMSNLSIKDPLKKCFGVCPSQDPPKESKKCAIGQKISIPRKSKSAFTTDFSPKMTLMF